MLSNNYVRKLLWGIGFALFCLLISSMYRIMLNKRNKLTLKTIYGGINLFSLADAAIFIIITILAGIRLNTGSDFYNYYIKFNATSSNILDLKEYFLAMDGYGLLSCIVRQFSNNEYAIFMVIAIILYGYLFILINKETEDKAVALTCYLYLGFFANSLNILKQCIAMAFVMSFYKGLIHKKYVRTVVCAVLAATFHFSAIFALLVIIGVVILKPKPSMQLLGVCVFAGIVAAVALPVIIEFIIRIFPAASGYSIYVGWRRNNQIRLVIAVFGMAVMYLFLAIILVKNKDYIQKLNNERYLEIVFLLLGLCINIASIRIWVVQRLALYFYQFSILLIPTLFKSLELHRIKNNLRRNLIIIMFVYLIFCGIFLGENEYYSYHTIFSGESPIYDADYNKMFR